jgi:hypothetical protein
VRIKRVALKDKGNIAIARRQVLDMFAAQQNLARAGLLKPGNQPQDRRFAAARRTEQNTKLAIADLEGNVLENLLGAELLRQPMRG